MNDYIMCRLPFPKYLFLDIDMNGIWFRVVTTSILTPSFSISSVNECGKLTV